MLITVAAVVGALALLAEPAPRCGGAALMAALAEPPGPRPRRAVTPAASASTPSWSITALFFLLPLYVMVVTSLKTHDGDPARQHLRACRATLDLRAWVKAWSTACTGLDCNGISVGFWNSVQILVPSRHPLDRRRRAHRLRAVVLARHGADLLFGILLVGAFVPYQVFIYPLVRIFCARSASTTRSPASSSSTPSSACR